MTFLLGKFDKLQNMRSKIYQRYQKKLSNIQFLKTEIQHPPEVDLELEPEVT